jgi:hypothetical protein
MHPKNPTLDRAQRALDLCRDIAACERYLTRTGDVHALTAAWMLPCYRAELAKLRLRLGPEEVKRLKAGLRQMACSPAHMAPPPSAMQGPSP